MDQWDLIDHALDVLRAREVERARTLVAEALRVAAHRNHSGRAKKIDAINLAIHRIKQKRVAFRTAMDALPLELQAGATLELDGTLQELFEQELQRLRMEKRLVARPP